MLRNVSFLSLCFLILMSLSFISLVHGEEVIFPDPNLEAAIREALGIPPGEPITDEDLAELTELDASERGIIDLTGIKHCINLQRLELGGNQINDLNPLSILINLHVLELWFNQIGDITPLSGLTNLRVLGLGWNQISNLNPLSGLTNLQWLTLDGNQISNLSPLSGLTSLQGLGLKWNQISNLSPLSGLTNLQELGLEGNQISDLSPLSSLTNLQQLDLGHNQISNISHLGSLTNLQWLSLEFNQINNISPLSNLTNLWALGLNNNYQISDISPLGSLTNLQLLWLGGNQIIDISPLSNLTNLQGLMLYGNQISDINHLANLTDLRVLYLDDNQIQDISPLEGLTKIGEWEDGIWEREGIIVHLGLSNNEISDISPLLNNPGIGEGDGIDLRGNQLDIQKLQEKEATILLFDTPFWRELHRPLAEEGYITEGLILDPLEDTAYNEWDIGIDFLESAGGEAEVTPREGDILIFREKEHRWRAYAFDIGNVFNWLFGEGAHATTYVVTYLRFEEEGEVDMWVGSDDDVSIWMNDQNVWVNAVLRGWEPDQDKFTAQVKAGWNRLLVKVNNRGGGGWGYSVRFPNIKPVEVSLNPDVMRLIGDVSGNGAVTAYDAALIMQFAVGLIDHLPAPTDVEVSSSPHPFKLRIPQVKAHFGDEIRLPILVEDASGLFAGGLILRYDPNVLKAEDVLAGALRTYGSAGASPSLWKASVEEEGILRIAFANEGEMKGSGTLFEVKMRSIGEGESEIKVETAELFMDWGVKVEDGLVRIIPTETVLLQNYPNPFNPETWIPFKLAEGNEVVIRFYDMTGRLVRMFDLGYVEAGSYTTRGRTVRWDGRNELGERVANGAYIYQLQTGDRVFVKRMVVMK